MPVTDSIVEPIESHSVTRKTSSTAPPAAPVLATEHLGEKILRVPTNCTSLRPQVPPQDTPVSVPRPSVVTRTDSLADNLSPAVRRRLGGNTPSILRRMSSRGTPNVERRASGLLPRHVSNKNFKPLLAIGEAGVFSAAALPGRKPAQTGATARGSMVISPVQGAAQLLLGTLGKLKSLDRPEKEIAIDTRSFVMQTQNYALTLKSLGAAEQHTEDLEALSGEVLLALKSALLARRNNTDVAAASKQLTSVVAQFDQAVETALGLLPAGPGSSSLQQKQPSVISFQL